MSVTASSPDEAQRWSGRGQQSRLEHRPRCGTVSGRARAARAPNLRYDLHLGLLITSGAPVASLADPASHSGQIVELRAQHRAGFIRTAERSRARHRMRFADATHLGAEMVCLHVHRHAMRVRSARPGFGDLLGHAAPGRRNGECDANPYEMSGHEWLHPRFRNCGADYHSR